MEEVDDDFGELYADVEVQAISAFNGVPGISHLSNKVSNESSDVSHSTKSVTEVFGDGRGESDAEMRSGETNEVGVASGSESDSDDEDDFYVVVNDDDFGTKNGAGYGREFRNVGEDEEKELVAMKMDRSSVLGNQDRVDAGGVEHVGERVHAVKNGSNSQYKFVRQYGSVSMGNERCVLLNKGDKENLGYIRNKKTSLGQVGTSCAGSIPAYSERGCSFWLPWHRTILDVDIDIFEQKPWNLPGVDMTDYFNFGFDEESWKSYCQSLDQLRQQTFTLGWNQVKRLRTRLDNGAYQKIGNRNVDEDLILNGDRICQESEFPVGQFKKQIGRAIHVKDSCIERLPIMDARPPRSRDSDVVIEITVQAPEDSHSGKEELDKIFETTHTVEEDGFCIENPEPEIGKASIHKSCDIARASVQENIQGPSELKSLNDYRASYTPMPQDSSGKGKENKSRSDALHEGEIDDFSGGYSIADESLNKSTEDMDRNSTETNPCVAGIDVLFDDQIQSSSIQSDSDICSKESEDIGQFDMRRTQDSRSSPGDSVSECDRVSREEVRDDMRMMGGAVKHRSRVRSPIEEDWNHHRQKVRKHSELSFHDKKDHGDRIGLSHCVSDRNNFSPRHHRSKARLDTLPSHEDCPRYREKEPPLRCNDRRTVEYKTSCRRDFHRWGRWDSGDEMDLYSPRGWDEDVYFSESGALRSNRRIVESEQYPCEREHVTGDRELLFQNQPRYTSTFPIDIKQRNLQWDHDGQCHKRIRCDLLLEDKYSNGHAQDKHSRPYSLYNGEVEFLDLDITSERHVHDTGREVVKFRRDEYLETPGLDFDHPSYIRDEDFNWPAFRPTCHYLDRHKAYNERMHGPAVFGNDLGELQMFENDQRHGRYISYRNGRDDMRSYDKFQACHRRDDVRYLDEDHCFINKHDDLQSKGVFLADDSPFSRHFDSQFYGEDELDSFKGVPGHRWDNTMNVCVPDGISMQARIVKHKQKILRGGRSNSCDINPMMPPKIKHQKNGVLYRNSVNLHHGRDRKVKLGKPWLKFYTIVPAYMMSPHSSGTMQPNKICPEMRRNTHHDAAKSRVQKQDRQHEVYRKQFEAGKFDTFDLEEGQMPTQEPSKEVLKQGKGNLNSMSDNQAQRSQNDSIVYDKNWIRETMAKMEKRRERFKEPIIRPKKETVADPKPQVATPVVVETAESKLQRPVRKRRWGER